MAEDKSQQDQLEHAAEACPSEVVYGLDNEGNRIILGIILKGSPDEQEQEYLENILDEQDEEDASILQWVAAEEECATIQDVKMEKTDVENEF